MKNNRGLAYFFRNSILLLSLTCHAATNQVFFSTNNGGILTTPWSCDKTALRSFTASAWVSVSESTSSVDRVVVERSSLVPSGDPRTFPPETRLNFQLGINPQGYPFARYQGAGEPSIIYGVVASTETVKANRWTLLATTFEFPYLKLYQNGLLIQTKLISELPYNGWIGSILSYPSTITIGASNTDPTGITTNLNSYFNGGIDEVIIWNGALTDSDINYWMNRKPLGAEPNLIAYWSFDNGTASDTSTNGIGGAFYNSTSSVERITFPAYISISNESAELRGKI